MPSGRTDTLHTGNGFRLDDGDYGTRMTLTGPWSPVALDAAQTASTTELYLNHALGWKGESLDWLVTLPGLRAIQILAPNLTDIGGLRFVPQLRRIRLEVSPRATIDLGQFPEIEEFSGFWVNTAETVFRAERLKRLRLIGYPRQAPKGFDCFDRLVGLALYSAQIMSLGDIGGISGLQSLSLAHCAGLCDLAGLELLQSLRELHIESCKNLNRLDAVATLKSLMALIVEDCGPIASLAPVRELRELRVLRFTGSTNIEDGDLTPVQGLEHLGNLGFAQRKHYNLSWRSLPRRLFESRFTLAWS